MALPAGLIDPTGRVSYSKKTKNNKNNKKRKEIIVSQAYNSVSVRPLLRRAIGMQIITVNLRVDFAAAFSTSATVPTYGSSSFNMGQFNGTAEYLGLFDQYRFNYLEAWLEPAAVIVNNVQSGLIVSAVDLDDANTPTTVQQVEDKPSSIVTTGNAAHYHRWIPHIAVAAYSGAFTAFSNAESQWIDSASNTVQHYGIKYCSSAATTAVYSYNLSIRANVSFRQPGI